MAATAGTAKAAWPADLVKRAAPRAQVFEIGTLQTSGALDLTFDLTVDTNKAGGFFSGDFVLFGGSPPPRAP
jgi:hypothetical protein